MSGERGGQGVGTSLPIQRSGNVALRKARTLSPQYYEESEQSWQSLSGG